ncbi:hypothetical protein HII36_31130 [Nonomuraea sp. NN258]|uniref:hypothetical protein n=1 Tax=Nonomuraea antri TaxID=2730852 RepID=UPI0015691F31|nr:hypothetical protein [Nonomuraea antri]NRQ36254.1 hypothetical protein [Nonomuraea antri]
MKTPATVVALFLAACVVTAGLFFAPVVIVLLTYGCGWSEDRTAETFAEHAVFDQVPPGARTEGTWSSYCEEDDEIVSVAQEYRFSGSPEDVLGFYRKVAAEHGWAPPARKEDADPDELRYCGTVDGMRVEMWLTTGSDSYVIDLNEGMNGWC